MNLYFLRSPRALEGRLADVSDISGRIFSFFCMNEGDDKFLRYSTPRCVAQEGLTLSNIAGVDIIECSIGVPLFSENAVQKLQSHVADEIIFYPCNLLVGGVSLPFFFGKVRRWMPLIDPERSKFMVLDGEKILDEMTFLNSLDEKFLIARDITYKEVQVVSHVFRDIAKSEKLRMDFVRAN